MITTLFKYDITLDKYLFRRYFIDYKYLFKRYFITASKATSEELEVLDLPLSSIFKEKKAS